MFRTGVMPPGGGQLAPSAVNSKRNPKDTDGQFYPSRTRRVTRKDRLNSALRGHKKDKGGTMEGPVPQQ